MRESGRGGAGPVVPILKMPKRRTSALEVPDGEERPPSRQASNVSEQRQLLMKRLSDRMRSNMGSEMKDSAREAKELKTASSKRLEPYINSETDRRGTELRKQKQEKIQSIKLKKMYRTPCQRM
jgi:hypothetical protein